MKAIFFIIALTFMSTACDQPKEDKTRDPAWQERQEEIEKQEEQEERGRTSDFNSYLSD